MWIANLFGGFIVLVVGFIVRFMKVSNLIAGFNTMSPEEKEKYDEEKLIRFVGNLLFITAATILLPGIMSLFVDIPSYFVFISWILFTIIIIGGVIFMNTGERLKK